MPKDDSPRAAAERWIEKNTRFLVFRTEADRLAATYSLACTYGARDRRAAKIAHEHQHHHGHGPSVCYVIEREILTYRGARHGK